MSNDRTLPGWLRLALTGMAVMQTVFGLALFLNPASAAELWPWPLSVATARLLAASTLVTVPLALLSVRANRFSVARIPLVMMIAYRVLQVGAGLVHIDRFDFSRPTTWNYFGGGILMLVLMVWALLRSDRLGRPVADGEGWLGGAQLLGMGGGMRRLLQVVGAMYVLIGVAFFVQGQAAAWLWFEPAKLTALTARLFASPALGLGLGMGLVARARLWREVAVPAAGMVTFGVAGMLAFLGAWTDVAPTGPAGYLIPATPLVLLVIGLYLLLRKRAGE